MHAFLVQSAEFIVHSCPDVLVIKPENSIGIEEVRQIQNFLSRKPIQEKNNTVYVLEAHLLTIPAQNALLKTLEEPPGNSEIYLVTDFPDILLPTVLSRVQIEKSSTAPSAAPDLSETKKLLEKIRSLKVGERIALVDELAFTRESALEFLTKLEHLLHNNLDIKLNYDLIVQTRQYLKANVNVKLAMDNLFMNLYTTPASSPV